MEVIYGLLPGMLLLGIIGVAVFFWAVKNGQYDDMEGAANRILMDDDMPEENLDELPEENPEDKENETGDDASDTKR
jgi:cbb3-type cytochrome oxidase maturation protein